MTPPDAELLRERIASQFRPGLKGPVGVAVSGGSDSLALLVLMDDWRKAGGPGIAAVTVDHGLREGSAAEAAMVGRVCAKLGVPHDILTWGGWDGQGNLQDKARQARYALIADWARERGVPCVALGHTANDQAETFLMRLAREAGVDGLAAMAPSWRQDGVSFVRPALRLMRAELRQVLRARGIDWAEDPSNEDESFDRVRARRALEALEPLGIGPATLSNVAHHMASVRQTLYWYTFLAARNAVRFQAGDILIDRKEFRALPGETARRLLQEALKWISGAGYPPRGKAMDLLLESIRSDTDMTLAGAFVTAGPEIIRISREAGAVAERRVPAGAVWDGRWRLTGPETEGAEIGALGEAGLGHCPARRETGLPATSLRASPTVWRGDTLVAAPLAGLENGWSAELLRDEDHFFAALLSH